MDHLFSDTFRALCDKTANAQDGAEAVFFAQAAKTLAEAAAILLDIEVLTVVDPTPPSDHGS